MIIDLQIHSTHSDGYLTPTEAAKFLAKQGVKVASLTDHNAVSGCAEFAKACSKLNIKAVPGMELYIKLGRTKINLLWYNFDLNNSLLDKFLLETQHRRRQQIKKHLLKLQKLGFTVEPDKILAKFENYIPVNHVIDEFLLNKKNLALIKKHLGKNIREEEVISHYFYDKKIGRLNESYVSLERVIKLRKLLGGQLIFGHPGKFHHLSPILLEKLKKLGLDGMEVLSPHHNLGATMYMQFLAKQHNFIMTAGSDFHRFEGEDNKLQSAYDYWQADSKNLLGIEKII